MSRSFMLPGVSVQDINKRIDERGFFAEIVRNDWKDLLRDDKIAQANLSLSHPGMIRVFLTRRRPSRSIGTNLHTNENPQSALASKGSCGRCLSLHFPDALFSREKSHPEGFLCFLHSQATVFGSFCLLREFICEDGLN